jgi:predicted O-linked N-acetylglucosamine transferase (SPINDLY family)
VSYLGYLGTMGVDYIDYLLADRTIVPAEHEALYAEKIVCLPSYQANDSQRKISERIFTREELGLPPDATVFCCMNNNYKITPRMFDIWMRILQSVPDSVLFLFAENQLAPANLRKEAERRGVTASRLVFASRLPMDEHLARYRAADLFIDTTPCAAGTTASDSLWAGVPVLTYLGRSFAGRVAASLMQAVGMPELIAHTLEDYEALAIELGKNPHKLKDLRAKLARNKSTWPLFDTARFRRNIEAGYATMWERYRRGEPPAGFVVS